MKILVVEDDPIHQKLAHAVLTAEGHRVRLVDRAETAEKVIEEETPEVIIVDLSLPGMNGLDLIRKIKQSPSTQKVAIIAVTGYPSKWRKQEALEAGCD